jgi:hypothetical protein
VPFTPHLSTCREKKKENSFSNVRKGHAILTAKKHVSVNKTFILFVNRLLSKVNITVIQAKSMQQHAPMGLGGGCPQWYSACLECSRPWVSSAQKKKKKKLSPKTICKQC